jgi:hypothetical protein
MSGAEKEKASAVNHEWQTQALAAASSANAQLEGDDPTTTATTPTVRLGNLCQISYKVARVSGTQQAVDHAGRDNELAYQEMLKGLELKRDIETILVGTNQAKVTGDTSTPRKTASILSQLKRFSGLPDGGIVRGVAGGEAGIIFQDQAIRRMSYVPGSPIIFQIDRITQDKGLYAPYSIIRAGEKIFFYAGQGFHKIEPGGVPEQIGREKVDRTFLADLDKGNLQLFMGAADPRSTRIFWAYKSVSGTSGTYDKLLGYDFLLDRFYPVQSVGEYLLGVSQTGLTLENLDSISTSLDALTLSLDAYATAVQPEIGQFNGSHVLGFFRGSSLEATIESAEQGTDENRIAIRGFRPVTDAATLYGSVSYRDTSAAAATAGTEVLVNARTGRCDARRDTRYSRFKVRIPAAIPWTFCAGVIPDIATGGTL